jgi:hypothetical protein
MVSILEVEAYFSRNRYLLCRPFASEIIVKYDNELMNLETSYQTLFTGLDADENDILNAYDLNNFFYWQTDKLMTEGSWNMQTGELFG